MHFSWHCSGRIYFCCFPLALANISPWPLMPFYSDFLWRTVTSKSPTIPFGIVACTFSVNLSRNSCIHRTTLIFTHELYSSKAAFTIAFFAAVNYNYDCKRRGVKHTKRTETYQSQITTEPLPFEPVEVNFCFLRGPLRWFEGSEVGFWTLEFVCFWKAQLSDFSWIV